MADTTDPIIPPAPALLSPRRATVIDASSVTFRWKDVEEAHAYRIEIASDPSFDTLLLDQETEKRTSLTVSNFFPEDEQTYFWRVIARGPDGWGNADHVESFTAASPEVARRVQADIPDEDEYMGPAAALVGSSAVEASAEITGDDALYALEDDDGVEHDRIESGQILGLALGILAVLVVAILVVIQWTSLRTQNVLSSVSGTSGYPELRENRARAAELLSGYGVAEEGAYRIPIDRAMELIVTESYQKEQPSGRSELPSEGRD